MLDHVSIEEPGILIEKLFYLNLIPIRKKPSFSIKRSEITYFIAKVNLTVDGETLWPVSLYRTSL